MQAALSTQRVAIAGTRLSVNPRKPTVARAVPLTTALFTKAKPAPAKAAKTAKTTKTTNVPATTFEADFLFAKKKISIGFTKSNELFVGRLAMLGVAFALFGEVLTGRGPLAQLGYELHESVLDVEFEILAIIVLNVVAAILPTSGKFVPEGEDEEERPAGVLQDPTISILDWKRFFGISGFGFTKENELFVGRMAQLGFAAALLGESLTGKGILGQIGLETGLPLSETEPLILFSIAFTVLAAIGALGSRGSFVDDE